MRLPSWVRKLICSILGHVPLTVKESPEKVVMCKRCWTRLDRKGRRR